MPGDGRLRLRAYGSRRDQLCIRLCRSALHGAVLLRGTGQHCRRLCGGAEKAGGESELRSAWDKSSRLGPITYEKHYKEVLADIDKGVAEGATLVLDGRNTVVEGYENGYFVGPTIFDHVTADMTIGDEEVFGPVLCIKRCKDFEEGLAIMNANPMPTAP